MQKISAKICVLLFVSCFFPVAQAELNDQGLISVLSIIDKAVSKLAEKTSNTEANPKKTEPANLNQTTLASSTLITMAKALGKLSFSRLQCGETEILGAFTQRVSSVPNQYQAPMRAAFQLGFDNSKESTRLLSEDECKRLTRSRQIKTLKELSVKPTPAATNQEIKKAKAPEKPVKNVDPSLAKLRLANMAGQLAYKKKYCGDADVVTRDFNEIIAKMPKELQNGGKESYWKGYKKGKKMNKALTLEKC